MVLTGAWERESFFNSLGLFAVFWPIHVFLCEMSFISLLKRLSYYYYYYYYLLFESFPHQFYLMVSHWSLSDSKFPLLSRTLLSILAVLSNAVIRIVSTCSPTSKSTRPFNNPLVIVPKAPITIGTFVTFMFHRFFNSLARSRYLSFFSHSFSFILWLAETAKSTILQVLFFCWLSLSLAFWPGLGDPFVG